MKKVVTGVKAGKEALKSKAGRPWGTMEIFSADYNKVIKLDCGR